MCYSIIFFTLVAFIHNGFSEELEESFCSHFQEKSYGIKNKEVETDDTVESISILSGMPSGMINGCVNVVTGAFIDCSVDLVTLGAEKLVVERVYSSDSEDWEINQPEYIFSRFGLKHIQKGSVTLYSKIKNIHIPHHKSFQNGLTNCGSGIINGRTHLRNNICYEADAPYLKEGSGAVKKFGIKRDEPNLDGDIYDLELENRTNRNFIKYKYKDVFDFRIVSSTTSYNFRNHRLSFLKYDFRNVGAPGNSVLTVKSSDAQKIDYYFSNCASQGYKKLVKVSSTNKPEVSYRYHREKLTHKIRPNNQVLYTTYYKTGSNTIHGIKNVKIDKKQSSKLNKSNDYIVDKVLGVYEPIGADEKLLPKYQFAYERKFKVHKGLKVLESGRTTVYDAALNEKNYDFDEYMRITCITEHLNGVYRKQKYYWGQKNSHLEGNLICSALADANDQILSCRYYEYDVRGNIIRENLIGNLTGIRPCYVKMNAFNIPDYSDVDVYTKHYQYSDDGLNLMLYEKDNRKEIYYTYFPGTELLVRKVIAADGGIRGREFFYYDDNGQVVKSIKDDGYMWEENDFSGVTERYIVDTSYTSDFFLPQNIHEKYLNLKTGQEELLKRTENIYDIYGRLIRQSTYDSQNVYRYSSSFEHDNHGNVTKIIDPYGYETYLYYDENDNLVCEHDTSNRYYTHYTYDFSNRLIASKQTHDTGDVFVTSHAYNVLGQRVSTTTPNGQVKKYIYDALGRVIETIHPEVVDDNGCLTSYSERVSYDICNNPIQKINKRGVGVNFCSNIRGQICYKQYADASFEKTEYTLDGLTTKQIHLNGSTTTYEYDYMERPCKKIVQGDDSQKFTSTSVYNHFHLLEEITPSGLRTINSYDYAGRLVSVAVGDSRKEFEYDSLSRLHKTREYFGYGENDFIAYVKEYDLVDRVVEERTEDSKGIVQAKVNFVYDSRGNKVQQIHYHLNEPKVTFISYTADNKVETTTDALGNLTKVVFFKSHINAWGQYVEAVETTDPQGNVTFLEEDTLGRVRFEVRKNAFGEVNQKREFLYDAEGNCVKQIDYVITPGKDDRLVVSTFAYDFSNQVVEIVEAFGKREQKRTRYVYNNNREKVNVIKPDGVSLNHEYDKQGRVVGFFASDNSFNYRYTYDLNSNVVHVDDLVQNTFTNRIYDGNNRLVQEVLPTGLKTSYHYDRMSRVTKLTMPDGSDVEYIYDYCNLKDIKRKNYKHTYKSYNLSLQVEESSLIGLTGNLSISYDELQRPHIVKSDHYGEKNQYEKVGNLIKRNGFDGYGSYSYEYGYDALYQLNEESGTSEHDYVYDSLFNMVKKDGKVHEVNDLNQLLNDSIESSNYDQNGNMIVKGDLELSYDALDRLVSVKSKDQKVFYKYDELNRRISRRCYSRYTVITTYYIYSSQNEIGSCDEDGNLLQLRVLGIGKGAEIGSAVMLELEGRVYAPIHDSSGSVRCLVDADTGRVFESYRYSAFGEEEIYDAKGKRQQTSINPWRFSSKRVDEESGFSYFGRRYYNAKTARWVTADPMGFEAGPNLYAYVFNSPLISFDLYGLERERGESRWSRDRFNEFAYGSSEVKVEETASESRNQTVEKQKANDFPLVIFKNFETSFKHYDKSQAITIPGKGGDPSCNGALCYTGGIDNVFKDYENVFKEFAKSWDDDIGLAYNASHFILNDIQESFLGLMLFIATEPVKMIHETWNRVFSKNKNARILQICHSQGAINVRNALLSYDPALRLQIDVVAIAPGGYIYSDTCGSVHHYRVPIYRDIVPYLDVAGLIRERHTTTTLKPHKDARWYDHTITSPTYQDVIKDHINKFKERNKI